MVALRTRTWRGVRLARAAVHPDHLHGRAHQLRADNLIWLRTGGRAHLPLVASWP
ncbi:hypothetical protein [Ornithinimicrobium kibberense]|uniref:hypothetical protein n=1 Tax=Ornithinimicrobium kibberense TaxID=282060 RepID=UPI0036114E7B